jgi:hypothetical protein
VARRTALTQQQLRQLRLVMQVFERQCRSTASQGECVLQNMASLSISRVLEDINDIRSSGGCSMDGGSSGSGRVSSSGSGNSSGPAERAEHSNNHGSGIAAAATQAAAAASSGPASSLATSPSAAAAAAAGVAASESTQTCTQPAVTAPASSSLEDEANANDGAAQIALIDSRLQRYMRLRNIQACAGNFLIVGHIDKLQMAELLVGESAGSITYSTAVFCSAQLAILYCLIRADSLDVMYDVACSVKDGCCQCACTRALLSLQRVVTAVHKHVSTCT